MRALFVLGALGVFAAATSVFACGGARTGPRSGEAPDYEAPAAAASSATTTTTSEPPTLTTSASAGVSASVRAAPAAPPSQISARHILVQWMGCHQAPSAIVRTREQARTVIDEVLARLKGGTDFARLAVEFSDEPGAGRRGGSLPRFGHGVMDKAFEQAAFALKIGEVSGVVETAFGFHVIQRTE